MALNVIFSDTDGERRAVPVGSNVAPGTPIIQGGRPAVTITGSGDYAGNSLSVVEGGVTTVLRQGRGGVSLAPTHATVAYTGTYGFPVAGASASTVPGTEVYLTSAGALTLTEGTNTLWGRVEFFRGEFSTTDTAVTIGGNL